MKLPKWVWSSNRLYAPVNRTFFRRFPKSLYKKLMGSDPINSQFRFCLEKFNGVRPHYEILKMPASTIFHHILASKKGGRTGMPPSDDRLRYLK